MNSSIAARLKPRPKRPDIEDGRKNALMRVVPKVEGPIGVNIVEQGPFAMFVRMIESIRDNETKNTPPDTPLEIIRLSQTRVNFAPLC